MATIADLTGETISSSYGSLLMVTDTAGITSSLQTVQDGLGANDSALKLSTTVVRVNGSLGVGVDSPEYVIHAQTADDYVGKFESTDAGASIILEDNGSTTDGNRITVTSDALSIATANVTALTIDSSQNVGIGGTPSNPLHVISSSVSGMVLVENTGANSNPNISIKNDARQFHLQVVGARSDNFEIWDATAAATRLAIDSSGSVGIGTAAPSDFHSSGQRLVVGDGSGEEGISIYSGSDSTGTINFADASSSAARYVGRIYYDHNANEMKFSVNGSTSMTIDSSGNVGIGVTPDANWYSGDSALQIGGTATFGSNTAAGAGNELLIGVNAVQRSTTDNYLVTDEASRYKQQHGTHAWQYAASGAAGAAITWSTGLSQDASGNVIIASIPTSDPSIAGALWSDSGTVKISAG